MTRLGKAVERMELRTWQLDETDCESRHLGAYGTGVVGVISACIFVANSLISARQSTSSSSNF